MLAFVFPGQGSQKKGMGAELFDQVPEFLAVEKDVNQLLGYDLRALCLDDAQDQLKQTQYTQPCLYTVNALHGFKALAEGKQPAYLAGHSLGEYNALLAAGAFDYLTGLKLVQKRGELMAQAKNGAMAAVIGLDPMTIKKVIRAEGFDGIDVANFNSPQQTVLSGPVSEIQKAIPCLEAAGARMCVALPVSAAFHSRYMSDAADAFSDFLDDIDFGPLQLPVVANVTGRLYPQGECSATIRSLLTRQIAESVQWVQSIRFLCDQGVTEFAEMGPGKVLAGLIKQIRG